MLNSTPTPRCTVCGSGPITARSTSLIFFHKYLHRFKDYSNRVVWVLYATKGQMQAQDWAGAIVHLRPPEQGVFDPQGPSLRHWLSSWSWPWQFLPWLSPVWNSKEQTGKPWPKGSMKRNWPSWNQGPELKKQKGIPGNKEESISIKDGTVLDGMINSPRSDGQHHSLTPTPDQELSITISLERRFIIKADHL